MSDVRQGALTPPPGRDSPAVKGARESLSALCLCGRCRIRSSSRNRLDHVRALFRIALDPFKARRVTDLRSRRQAPCGQTPRASEWPDTRNVQVCGSGAATFARSWSPRAAAPDHRNLGALACDFGDNAGDAPVVEPGGVADLGERSAARVVEPMHGAWVDRPSRRLATERSGSKRLVSRMTSFRRRRTPPLGHRTGAQLRTAEVHPNAQSALGDGAAAHPMGTNRRNKVAVGTRGMVPDDCCGESRPAWRSSRPSAVRSPACFQRPATQARTSPGG